MELIQKLNLLLSKRDKHFLCVLLFFSMCVSIIETAGVSIIMPFISVASDFKVLESNKYFNYVYNLFKFSSPVNFVVLFGIFLILFYIVRSLINLSYFYLLSRFSFGRYHIFAYKLFQNYLSLTYREFVDKNTSTLTKTIINEAQNLTNLIAAVLFLLSEVFIVVLLYIVLLYTSWKITIALTVVLMIKSIFLIKTVSKKIKREGEKRVVWQEHFYETINSSFGNFKIIKLISNYEEILKKFAEASFGFAKANIINVTLSHVPRLFLETTGFGIMCFVVIYLVYKYQTDIRAVIPIITMYVLALYRLMPSFHRILDSYNQIMFYRRSLDIVYSDLMYKGVEKNGDERIWFKNEIKLKNVSFAYDHEFILKDVNLTIRKGEKIAFTGESGAGKSTLVDLIIGLYKPVSGKIMVDDVELSEKSINDWRKKIGYIPQSVYLFDGTVGENVAFGREYDEERAIEVLKQARIWDFLKEKQGLLTRVGEGGIKLSGGQKQRIAIARALYSDPEILVLDEATSALDNETEAKIMDEIYSIAEKKTLIIIAHRLSTIQRCQRVYKVSCRKVLPAWMSNYS